MADSEDDEAPPERDVKDFSFKQMSKIRMFDSPTSLPTARSSLLAASTKYGFIFVGCPTGIKVIKTETIEKIHESDEGSMQNIVAHCPSLFVDTGHSVRFVGLSCDDLTLSVCYENGNQSVMALYDVPTIASSNHSNAKFGEIILSSDAGVNVSNILWNPGFPGIFAVCLSSGSVTLMELTPTEIKTLASLPGGLKASAICWSPKGKQFVVGHRDGRLTQYSQALEVKKEIECPEIFVDDPHLVTDLLWITATLFAAVYSSFEEGDTPKCMLISTPKNEPRTITNFDDIYYVMSEERQPVFYLKNISEWTMLVSVCSNGFEAAVIAKYGGEATTPWEKWNFEETGRAEMPLTNNNDETFPMGMTFDFSSTRPIVLGEKKLPPAPIMMLLSTDGVLCPFYMINQTPNANVSIIKALEPLPQGGQRKAVVSTSGPSSTGPDIGVGPQSSAPPAPSTAGDLPAGVFSFAGPKPAVSSAPRSLLSGLSGNLPAGAFSFGSSIQPVSFSSGTPVSAASSSVAPNAFSFASPKQPLSSGMSGSLPPGALSFGTPIKQTVSTPGNAPGSAFSSTSQKQPGLMAFKPPTQSQVPAAESGKPLGSTPQLIKPTPTSQTQPASSGLLSFQKPSVATASSAKTPSPAQNVSVSSQPKAVSSVPSQAAGQGLLAQPKPMPAKTVITRTSGTRKDLYNEQSERLPETKSTPLGFKLPGQPTVTMGAAQEATRKTAVPVSKGNVVDASVSENIQEAISLFDKEMAKLHNNVKSMQRSCCLTDDNNDLVSLRKTTDEIGRRLADIKVATKDQHKDIDDEKRKALEAFEMLEDARIRQEKKSDPRYVQLLKSRALDPVNANKMREIRNLHLYLDKTLREVNMVLDEQWNKENQQKRSIQRPALDEVYQTLRVHQKIAQDQAAKLEQITQDMKNRKLLSTMWQRSSVHTTSLRDDLSSLSDPFAVSKQEVKSPNKNVSAPISPEKQAQLRSMFQKRGNTPVRRSWIVPTAVTKTPIVKPSRPEVPFFASTPAIKPGDTSEGSKGAFSFGDPIREQSEASESVSSPSEESQEEESGEEQELGQWNVSSSSRTGPPLVQSGAMSSSKGSFSLGMSQGPHPARMSPAAGSTQTKSTPQLPLGGTFPAVDKSGSGIKPPGPQTIQAEPAKPPSGLFLPTAKTEPSISAAAPPRSEFAPNVKVISTETPPNIAAGMAAMSRLNASHGAVQPSSNLDPSASIEPVTLVTYKPQTQGGAQSKDIDTENNAAKAIANAALMAAAVEAQKPSTKPQVSTEFIFKSTDSGKPGPPVVTFKPPTSPPEASESTSKVTAAPNVSVNPTQVFKPAFTPAQTGTPTAPKPGGLQQSFTGSPASGSPFSFAPGSTGNLFNLGSSSAASASAPSAFSFSSKTKDTVPSPIPAAGVSTPSAAKPVTTLSAPAAGITPSARVSRNLFAAADSSSQAVPVSGEQDTKVEDSKEAVKTLQVTTAAPSTVSSSGIPAPATTTTGFAFSAPAPSGGGFFKNLNLTSPSSSGNVFGTGDSGSNPPSILGALMRSSAAGNAAGNTGSLFGTGTTVTPISNEAASTPTTLPSQTSPPSKSIPSENKDTSTTALTTTTSTSFSVAAGGIFAQALSESSKPSVLPATTAVSTLPATGSLFGAPTAATSVPAGVFGQALGGAKPGITAATTAVSTSPATGSLFGVPTTAATSAPGGVFGQALGGAKPGITAPTTTAANTLLGLSAGSGTSAFSATTTAATPFFPSISGAPTNASAPTGGTPLTAAPLPTASPAVGLSTPATGTTGLFGKVTSTPSAFGAVASTTTSGIGLPGATSTAGTGSLFGAPTSTAFAPTPVFGTSSGNTFGSAQPFSSPASSQGSTFGSTPVFGSPATTAGTGSVFGSTVGQSSFATATSTGFGAASKPAESALGFGFGGFGLGGQATSQASKTNPFGVGQVSQGFGAPTSTQSSLFGGKSGADVFKMSDSPKPAFGSGPFSQTGFGSQSSGGFSGGSFSVQGGSVASSGFGFGAPAPSTGGFGSPQPGFGSPSSAGGSVFGGAPAFGSAPAFGGAPAFGSSPQGGLGASLSGGVFGSAGTGGFGQSQGSPTFGSLASQPNVPSFGAVAGTQGFGGMQQQQQQQATPSFGSFGGGGSQSPSGVSFSQWR